jgi:hypothetical protein
VAVARVNAQFFMLAAAVCDGRVSQYKGGAGNNEFPNPIFHAQGERGKHSKDTIDGSAAEME